MVCDQKMHYTHLVESTASNQTHQYMSSKLLKCPECKNISISYCHENVDLNKQIKDEIMRTDINTLTPVEALMKLNDIKKLLVRELNR